MPPLDRRALFTGVEGAIGVRRGEKGRGGGHAFGHDSPTLYRQT